MTISNTKVIPLKPAHITLVPSQFSLQLQVVARAAAMQDGSSFPAPAVFIFSQWVKDIAYKSDLLNGRRAAFSPAVQQIRSVWTRAIQSCIPEIDARECLALAKQARAADRLINQWLEEPLATVPGSNWNDFLHWRTGVQQAMQQKNWFNAEDWLSHFVEQSGAGEIIWTTLPQSIELAGFVEITRLEQRVIDALVTAGVEVSQDSTSSHRTEQLAAAAPKKATKQIMVQHFESLEHELTSIANWAKAEMGAGRQRVACIINNLDGLKDRVSRVFEDIFHPRRVLGLGGFANSSFHVSSKPTLASQPLVKQALDLLQLSINGCRTPLEFPLISRFLLANNWHGADTERAARASLELLIRHRGWYRLSLAALAETASGHQLQASVPILIRLCSTLAPPLKTSLPAQQLMNWLAHWGWPGEQGLDGIASRAVQQLLGELEALSMQPCSNPAQCLQQLRRQCEDATISMHGGAWSPVQVLSPAEAFGQHFDCAWVGNLSDSNWPGRAIANPFIPSGLMASIPRGSDNGMLAYTEQLMQNIANCAQRVIFSAANRYQDVPQGISPLLNELGAGTVEVSAPARSEVMLSLLSAPAAGAITDYARHPWLQAHLATRGLRLPENEARPLRGIVTRFNYQSACPLASYLVYRLNARMPEPPGPFVDAAFRGKLMHTALEHLYRPFIGTGKAPGLSDIAGAVAAASRAEYAGTRLMPASYEAEKTRLQRLLSAWLTRHDLKPGGQPIELEWQCKLSFASFEFNIRIDRLDRVAHDKVFIIDYKSGGVNSPAWANERLENMQLPLYAVALEQAGRLHPAGVALAQLKPGDFKVFGITEDESAVCKGVQVAASSKGALASQFENWDALLGFWAGELTKLAKEIRAGDCSHQLYNEKALKYSGLEGLLRNSELQHWCLDKRKLPSGMGCRE